MRICKKAAAVALVACIFAGTIFSQTPKQVESTYEEYKTMDLKYCIADAERCFIWNFDDDEALNILKIAADRGSVDAMRMLGFADEKNSFYWFEKAAAKGDAVAFCWLAYDYWQGDGTEQDLQKAQALFKEAISLGYETAKLSLAVFYTLNEDKISDFYDDQTLEILEYAINKGNIDAKVFLANIYLSGKGVQADKDKAIKLYKEAAEVGNSLALVNLAVCYYLGDGVPKDGAKVEGLCKEAIMCENTRERGFAYFLLGKYYSNPEFGNVNNDTAEYCFKKAKGFGYIPE